MVVELLWLAKIPAWAVPKRILTQQHNEDSQNFAGYFAPLVRSLFPYNVRYLLLSPCLHLIFLSVFVFFLSLPSFAFRSFSVDGFQDANLYPFLFPLGDRPGAG